MLKLGGDVIILVTGLIPALISKCDLQEDLCQQVLLQGIAMILKTLMQVLYFAERGKTKGADQVT